MPEHIRHNVIVNLRKALDSLIDYDDLEILKGSEKMSIADFKNQIQIMMEIVFEINEKIREEKRFGPSEKIPFPRAPEPKVKIRIRKEDEKVDFSSSRLAEKLDRKLFKMRKQLEELNKKQKTKEEKNGGSGQFDFLFGD